MTVDQTKLRFGRYEIIRRLDSGALAEVFEAVDTASGRKVLLRVLTEACSQNPHIQQVYEEFRDPDARRVDDPNVLRLLDCGQEQGRFWFAFEFIEGETLQKRLERERPSTEEGLAILRQVAEALRGIHQRKLVHGDVKPANIYVGRDPRNNLLVKLSLVDLALSGTEAMVSVYGELVGTPKYLSPEQIEGRHVGPRSDIFSLGVTAYEMFSGREPFRVQTPLGYLRANCERDATPLAALDTSIAVEVSAVVQKMMSREPTRRYRNCQSLLDDLDRVESRMAGDLSEVVAPGSDSAFAAEHPVMAAAHEAPPGLRTLAVGAVTVALVLLGVTIALVWMLMKQTGGAPATPETPPAAVSPAPTPQPATPATRPRPTAAETPAREPDAAAIEDPIAELNRARRLADEDLREGRFTVAEGRFERLIEKFPKGPMRDRATDGLVSTLFAKASILEEARHDAPAAIEALLDLAAKHPEHAYARRARERAAALLARQVTDLTDAGKLAEAEAANNRLKELDPKAAESFRGRMPDLMVARARKALDALNPDEALALLKRVAEEHKDSPARAKALAMTPEAQEMRGQQLMARNEFQEACDLFGGLQTRNAPALRAEALYRWCGRLWKTSRAADAAQALDKWAQLNREFPNSPWIETGRKEMPDLPALQAKLNAAPGPVTEAGVALARADMRRDAKDPQEYEQALLLVIRGYPDTPQEAQALKTYTDLLRRKAEILLARGQTVEGREVLNTLLEKYGKTENAAWARGQIELVAQAPPGMVVVPAGRFRMGLSLAQADEHARQLNMFAGWAASYFLPMTPEREVEIAQSYAIDRTEVPNEDYEKFVAATQRTPPPSPQWDGPRAKKGFEKHPVTHVTYRDARDYAEWAGKRLPTEAEWERAARGTDGRLWPWGNAFDNRKAHVFGGGRGDGPLPVGSVETDLSPVGCVDMAGNVREWTADRYEPYPDSKADPKWFQAGDRVVRGGCFAKGEGDERFVLLDCSAVMRISRNAIAPPAGLAAVGFRCAKTLGPAPADKPK